MRGLRCVYLAALPTDLDLFRTLRKTKKLGEIVAYFQEVESTMIPAKNVANTDGTHGALFLAEAQTAGALIWQLGGA